MTDATARAAGGVRIAVLAVVVTKGSWQRLGRIHLSALPLLLVALAIQAVLEIVDFPKDRVGDVGFGILMLSYALILAFVSIMAVGLTPLGAWIAASRQINVPNGGPGGSLSDSRCSTGN